MKYAISWHLINQIKVGLKSQLKIIIIILKVKQHFSSFVLLLYFFLNTEISWPISIDEGTKQIPVNVTIELIKFQLLPFYDFEMQIDTPTCKEMNTVVWTGIANWRWTYLHTCRHMCTYVCVSEFREDCIDKIVKVTICQQQQHANTHTNNTISRTGCKGNEQSKKK